MNKRRSFSREFKLAAVNKVMQSGLSVSEVARDLGVRDTMIHNWKRTFLADGSLARPSDDSLSLESELKRLREENRQLKMEREILKKATAFFAKENP